MFDHRRVLATIITGLVIWLPLKFKRIQFLLLSKIKSKYFGLYCTTTRYDTNRYEMLKVGLGEGLVKTSTGTD